MTRFFTLFAVSALAAASFGAAARTLTPAEALAAAKAELPQGGPARVPASTDFTSQPVLTLDTPDGEPTVYLFSAPQGYIVAAADDAAGVSLLGFSGSERFDASDIPPQMSWWLDELSQQVAYAASHPDMVRLSPAKVQRAQIEPIVKTLWNQDAPYNNLCPILKNSSGVQSRAVTGCVATAMAQAIKVFNYPQQGIGSNSYSFTYLNNSYSASFDFAGTTFNWDQMSNTYDSSSSAASNEAVATLMKACGVAVNMNYGLSATGGSGASTVTAASALVNYFDFDQGVHYMSRECYTLTDWNDIVYNEIAAGRPVIYSGHSNEGGHAFVCDGYSQDEYFHINWGWGGMSNGYFLLSVLDPPSQGIGGSNSGFNMGQGIIAGICPPGSAGASGQVLPMIQLEGNFAPEQTEYSKSSTVVFGTSQETMFYNASIAAIPVTLGLKLTNESTGAVSYISSYNTTQSLPARNGWYQMSISGSAFPVGTYKVQPAFQSNGQWYDVLTSINIAGYVQAVVNSSTITFTVPSASKHARVTSCSMLTPIYIGEPAEFEINIQANGNYYGTVIPALVNGTSIYATGTLKGISLDDGETATIDWVSTFSGSSLSAGTYDLVFITDDYYLISDRYPVTVKAAQTTTPSVQVVSVSFPGSTGNGTSSSPFIIDPNDLECQISLKSTSGYWADNVEASFFDTTTGGYLTAMGSQFAGIESGRTVQLNYKGDVDSMVAGNTYYFVPWGSTKGQLSSPYYVKATTTGVDTLSAESAKTAPRYFTLQGVEVTDPQAGHIYIVVRGNQATKQIF